MGCWKRAGVADVGRSQYGIHRAKDLNAQEGSGQRLALECRSGRCWEMGCGWKRQELVDAVAEREQREMSRFGLDGWLGCSYASGCMSPGPSGGEARRRRDGVGVDRIEREENESIQQLARVACIQLGRAPLDPSGACSSVGRICGPRSPRPQPTGALTTALVRKIQPGLAIRTIQRCASLPPYRFTA